MAYFQPNLVSTAGLLPVMTLARDAVKVPAGPARILGESAWIITALFYVAVIATVFFASIQVFIGTSGF